MIGFLYVTRLDFEDETFSIVEIPADGFGEAVTIGERDPSVVKATVLGTIDTEPQTYLAASA